MDTIKLHGLPRSGTNFLQKVLEANFFVRVCAQRKHFPAQYEVEQRVFITKHVVDWVLSFYEFAVKTKLYTGRTEWAEYLRSGLAPQFGVRNMWFANPAHVWNAYNHHYLNHKDILHIQWEMLLDETKRERVLEFVGDHCRLKKRGANWVFPPERIDPLGKSTAEPFTPRERASRYTDEQIAFVMGEANQQLLERLRYRVRT